jgi:hypothetical protein
VEAGPGADGSNPGAYPRPGRRTQVFDLMYLNSVDWDFWRRAPPAPIFGGDRRWRQSAR